MKINKAWFFVLVSLFSISCSNLSKNIVQDGQLLLRNGTYNDKQWKEDLAFKRTSWYHELTMQLDVMMAKITPQSSFNFWFSKDELDTVVKCSDARVVMAYSLDTKDIPYSSVYEQLELAGYTRFDIKEFKKNLLQHPDSQQYGFRLYHVFGICKKTKDLKPLIMNYPGYLEKLID